VTPSLAAGIGAGIVLLATLVRLGWVIVGTVRSRRYQDQAKVYNLTWIQRINGLEPFVLVAVAVALAVFFGPGDGPSWSRVAGSLCGAALAILALAISFWAIASFPKVATGHFVLADHAVVERGPYAYIRHPFYSAVFLLWLAVALAFPHWSVPTILLLYVAPSYLNYIRAEEEMLVENLGAAYVSYRHRTGKLFPRLRGGRKGAG